MNVTLNTRYSLSIKHKFKKIETFAQKYKRFFKFRINELIKQFTNSISESLKQAS